MEKPSFEGVKLPIGYWFHPTDEELVVHYLRRKVLGFPLPVSIIPDLDVFQSDPWSLPSGDAKEKRYFFSRRKGNEEKCKKKKPAGSGYWKPIGKGKLVVSSISNQVVGMRKTLVFCHGKHSLSKTNMTTTQWVMHEYSLVALATTSNTIQMGNKNSANWAIHRIFQRKRRSKRHGSTIAKASSNAEIMTSPSLQPSSPCSSGITEEVFSNDHQLDGQEEITSNLLSFTSQFCIKKI